MSLLATRAGSPVTRGRVTVLAAFHGADANNASVDGAAHTVILLVVHLGNLVVINDAGLANITKRGRVDHILDNEPLNSLILLGLAAAAVAKNGSGHAAAVLGASIIAPLLRHAVIEICPESTTHTCAKCSFYGGRDGLMRNASSRLLTPAPLAACVDAQLCGSAAASCALRRRRREGVLGWGA